MSRITPFLWFDDRLREAIDFYTRIFENSQIENISSGPDGSVFAATFELAGQRFMALNGGPALTFTEAVSFFVNCETQAEVDYYWAALSAGGSVQQCGWLKDQFGLSWQIVPGILGELLGSRDREKATRAHAAMLQMRKLDIAKLVSAVEGN